MDDGIRVRLQGRELAFTADRELLLGRDPHADIHSDNPLVSRRHAVLNPHTDGWLLEDTESRHGTYFDGRRINRMLISGPSTIWLAEPGEGQVLLLIPDVRDTPDPTGIFMSYRRRDAGGYSGWLYDGLSTRFGGEQIFRDIDTVGPGTHYPERIQRAVGSCRVLIPIIGPAWLDARDDDGRRRLDDPHDLVRVEIEAALERPHVRVIPVLVAGATMPPATALPPSMQELTFRHALEMSDTRWDYDLSRLIAAIDSALGAATPIPDPDREQDPAHTTQPPRRDHNAGPPPDPGPPASDISVAWWLVPLLFSAPGGLFAWWRLRDRNRKVANGMLVLGLIMTFVYANGL